MRKETREILPDDWVIIRKISEVKNEEKDDFNQIGIQINAYAAETEKLAREYLSKHIKGNFYYGVTSYSNFKRKTNGNKGHYLINTIELDVLNNLFSDHINKDGNKVEKIHKNS